MEIVFHLSTDNSDKVSELIGNVKNLMVDKTVETDSIHIVINADGINTILKERSSSEYLKALSEEGAIIKACSNSIEGQEIDEKELIDDITVVSSGVGELVKLQDQGFSYIRI